MMYKSFEKGIEVNGRTIFSIVNALKPIRFIVRKIFLDVGLPDLNDIRPDQWYSQQQWLDAFKLLADKAGPHTLMSIGEKIPDHALFPADITNIFDSIASIDVAYHLNHRNSQGQILFENGKFHEGIGHYKVLSIDKDNNKVIIKCENPYPCYFDQGIITRMVKKFEPEATILHDESNGCRRLGFESCTFIITW